MGQKVSSHRFSAVATHKAETNNHTSNDEQNTVIYTSNNKQNTIIYPSNDTKIIKECDQSQKFLQEIQNNCKSLEEINKDIIKIQNYTNKIKEADMYKDEAFKTLQDDDSDEEYNKREIARAKFITILDDAIRILNNN